MDKKTMLIYDRYSHDFADEWSKQPEPTDMYEILREFFQPGLTADIGCGVGRDTAWLNATGFPAIGYDASEGLLSRAKQMHPDLCFYQASLPALTTIENNTFTNVLCETVIMHLKKTRLDRCSYSSINVDLKTGRRTVFKLANYYTSRCAR